jgi:parallel beta-helix repeat protein
MSRNGSYLRSRGVTTLRPLALSLALSFAVAGLAIGQTYTVIDYPGAANSYAATINNGGDILGSYNVLGGASRGFLLSAGKFTQIDYPDAKSTNPKGMNAQGDIVGTFTDAGGTMHGFLLSKGKFTSLDYPGAAVQPYAINATGDIVGMIQFPGKPMQGFLLKGGAWTMNDYLLDVPSTTMNCYLGINDAGVMVGHWTTRAAGSHGVVYTKGTATQLDFGAGGDTEAYAINSTGDIAGYYVDVSQAPHGFVRRNGRFTPIDYPGSLHTMVYGINDSGQVAGHFQDANKAFHGFVAQLAPAASAPPVLTVDDDGFDCPGALHTIQEAVDQARAGTTILVCPGTYRGTVNIIGAEKTALKLIAVGRTDEVVLQGDYTQRDGFHLENVTNVVIRGFTVRDFGNKPTTAAQWGTGNQIYLENAAYNTIEQNHVINGDMMGIMLMDSGNNTVQNNVAWVNSSALANCGIHVQGAKSANNQFLLNYTYGNNVAGIMLSNAGPGNWVVDNITTANGRDGITNTGTNGTWIEGNRTSYNRGPWGTTPYAAEVKGVGRGITIGTSTGVTVVDNRVRGNSGTDINWDGNGEIKFDLNACDTSTPGESCSNAAPTPAPGTAARRLPSQPSQ